MRGPRKVFVSELICQRRVVEEDDMAYAGVERKRFERLERALEGQAGQAIAATNRDKRQLQSREKIETRLADPEKRQPPPHNSAPPSAEDTRWGRPTPHRLR